MFTTTKKIAVLIMCSTVLVSCGSLEADRSSNFDIMPKAKLFATEHNEVSKYYDEGFKYHHGVGVIQDHVRAKDLYEKAIDISRDSRAMNELAVLLVTSEDLPKKDIKLGLDLLVRSSNLGNSSARFNLGLFYLHGHYVLKDESRGISLIRTAANQGNTGAQAFLVNLAMEAQENVVRDYPNVKEEIKFLVERGYVEMWEVASEGSRYRGLWNKFFKYEMTDRSRMLSDLMALGQIVMNVKILGCKMLLGNSLRLSDIVSKR